MPKEKLYFKEEFEKLKIRNSDEVIDTLSTEVLTVILNCIKRFFKTFPITIDGITCIRFYTDEELKETDPKDTDACCEYISWINCARLLLNLDHFTTDLEKIKKWQAKKLKIDESKSIESIIYHELGHLLDYRITHKLFMYKYKNSMTRDDKIANNTKFTRNIIHTIFHHNYFYIIKNVSWYEPLKSREVFAELIAIIMVEKDLRISAQKLKDYLIESGYMI